MSSGRPGILPEDVTCEGNSSYFIEGLWPYPESVKLKLHQLKSSQQAARRTNRRQEGLGNKSSSCIQEEFHFRDLLVNLFHELYYEIDQLVLQHLFCMRIRD